MARLLVYTPTYDNGPQPRTLESVAEQQFDGELVYVVDKDNPYPNRDMRNVLVKYQKARQMVLDDDFDGLLMVEHDMDIPPNAAQVMWDTPAPVVYAPYLLRHGANVLSLWLWSGGKNLGMSLSLYPRELVRYHKAGVGPVCGVGFGCTLVRRDVLAKIPFRGPDNQAPDIPFALDCIQAGIQPLGRFDIECGHYHDGHWLWPWRIARGDIVGRIYMLRDVNANVSGQSIPLKRGKYYSLPSSVRQDLVRAGYAKHIGDDPDEVEGMGEVMALNPVEEKAVAPEQAKTPKRKPRRKK